MNQDFTDGISLFPNVKLGVNYISDKFNPESEMESIDLSSVLSGRVVINVLTL